MNSILQSTGENQSPEVGERGKKRCVQTEELSKIDIGIPFHPVPVIYRYTVLKGGLVSGSPRP